MLSYDIESQTEIFDKKILLAWENFPEVLKEKINLETSRSNQLKIGFGRDKDGDHYSSILVRTKGRSGTFNRVHISEFAKICREDPRKAKEIISGTIQAVPLNGRVDIESTAEGDYGEFHDMFWEAWERGEPKRPVDYKAHFYNWTYDEEELAKIMPDFDIPKDFRDYQREHTLSQREITYYYYKWLSLSKDWDLLRQEYPTTPEEAFVSSGDKFFNVDKLKKQKFLKGEIVSDWVYYEDYVPGHRYALGADVGEGIGKHASTIVIIDFDYKDEIGYCKPKVVAYFKSNRIGADILAQEVKNGGTRYGNCIAGVERNNHGHATLTVLKGIYNNIYTEERKEFKTDRQTQKLGWNTNAASKPKMMYDLKTAITEELIVVSSRTIIRELWTYPTQDLGQTKFREDDEHHWDLVIALAIAWQMRIHAIPSIPADQLNELEDDSYDPQGIVPEI